MTIAAMLPSLQRSGPVAILSEVQPRFTDCENLLEKASCSDVPITTAQREFDLIVIELSMHSVHSASISHGRCE